MARSLIAAQPTGGAVDTSPRTAGARDPGSPDIRRSFVKPDAHPRNRDNRDLDVAGATRANSRIALTLPIGAEPPRLAIGKGAKSIKPGSATPTAGVLTPDEMDERARARRAAPREARITRRPAYSRVVTRVTRTREAHALRLALLARKEAREG